MNITKLLIASLLLAFSLSTEAQTVAPFKSGDRIMFVGNSITDAGHYHSYIWLYYMTRFPERRIEIINKGIGGDDAGLINERLNVEVFPEKPTVVALTFGMNDSGYFEYLNNKKDSFANVKYHNSYDNYQKIEKKLLANPSVRKIIFTSAPYDETTTSAKNRYYPGKAKTIQRISDFQEASARKNKWEFLDLNKEMTTLNLRGQVKDSAFSLSPGDRIHPELGGHLVMAYYFLKAQGLDNKVVADVQIDAAKKRVIKQENSTITNLNTSAGKVSFDYLAKSLPFPMDTLNRMWNSKSKQSDALNLIPFMEEFNKENLQVSNLNEGRYRLSIDGVRIGEWSANELSDGINLAAIVHTPQYQQASVLRDLNQERMEIERRFRQYNWMEFDILHPKGLLRKHNQEAVDTVMSMINTGFIRGNFENWSKAKNPVIRQAWMNQMKLLVDTIYANNKPLKRRVSIEKID